MFKNIYGNIIKRALCSHSRWRLCFKLVNLSTPEETIDVILYEECDHCSTRRARLSHFASNQLWKKHKDDSIELKRLLERWIDGKIETYDVLNAEVVTSVSKDMSVFRNKDLTIGIDKVDEVINSSR
ncbi:hypothetical protein RsTz2092_04110 [Deferribacterales bacterium RsTz2092]